MIQISELDYSYGPDQFRLQIQELSIADGEKIALIGESGIGKTTLLNLIAGIYVASKGSVAIDATNFSKVDEATRRQLRVMQFGLVFQELELLEYLSVRDNILLPYRVASSLSITADIIQRCEKLAQTVGVSDQLNKLPSRLSQGEKQRVAVCRALIMQPQLILADEPTGNLDPDNKQRVVDLLLSYAEESKVTLLMITHDRGCLDRFDRVIDFSELLEESSLKVKNERNIVPDHPPAKELR